MKVSHHHRYAIEIEDQQQVPRISVIIPARDEAQNLRYVLPLIPPIVSEVILVDGHSSDNTIELARQLLPGIRVVRQLGQGKGDALRLGFSMSTGDILIMLDADGSADPNEIPHFVSALLQGYDFAKGSRFLHGGRSYDISLLRRLGNACLRMVVNQLFLTRFSDFCYGYNAFWRHCLNDIEIESNGFEVEALLNLRAHKANLHIIEVPSVEYARLHGHSKLRAFHDGWQILKTILKERYSQKRAPDKETTRPEEVFLPVHIAQRNVRDTLL